MGLFLACDGVFDVMSNEEVKDFVLDWRQRAACDFFDGGDMLVALLKHCLEAGSKDNCSACYVQLSPGAPLKSHSHVLLEGDWQKAKPAVKTKYAEFFAMHGFVDEATEINKTFPHCMHPKCDYLAHTNPQNNPTHCCLRCRDSPEHEKPEHGPE